MTQCECPDPGDAAYFDCKQHGCRKHARWWTLCQTREEYFRAWEEGRGPGQAKVEILRRHMVDATRRTVVIGVGTELKLMLSRIGIREQWGCHCAARAIVMDKEGPDWCEKNKETIVIWLEEEAKRRKLPFVRVLARLLVSRAIRSARRKLAMMEARR